ncbi:MAG: hypothetical protein JWM16_2662 [Verrucomicrobiales bacterium]|nr:hypothetical protein [Verrucomicrobiales bacterium]
MTLSLKELELIFRLFLRTRAESIDPEPEAVDLQGELCANYSCEGRWASESGFWPLVAATNPKVRAQGSPLGIA